MFKHRKAKAEDKAEAKSTTEADNKAQKQESEPPAAETAVNE